MNCAGLIFKSPKGWTGRVTSGVTTLTVGPLHTKAAATSTCESIAGLLGWDIAHWHKPGTFNTPQPFVNPPGKPCA